MVKIRLRRTGAKKKPTYRVVITDSRSPRDGHFIEIVGHYNPRTEPVTFNIQEDRVLHWLSEGAQPTDTVRKMLANIGTLERFARLKAGADLEEILAEAASARQENLDKKAQTKPALKDEPKIELSEEVTEDAPAADDDSSAAETGASLDEVSPEDE